MNLNTNALALATFQVRERAGDDHVRDRRVVAIGLVHTSAAAGGDLDFHIDAIACDPVLPSKECASQLASWILAQTDKPVQLVAWGVRDPLIAGLSDIASKVEARVARDLAVRFRTWSVLDGFDISGQFVGSGINRLEDAAQRLIIDYLPLRSATLEPDGSAQREHLRDVVATAAIASWRIWGEVSGGVAPRVHEAAIRALAQWRACNRTD